MADLLGNLVLYGAVFLAGSFGTYALWRYTIGGR